MFDYVACINLDRRHDRWERFVELLPAAWPFARPERYAAVDGSKVPPPEWFRTLPAQRPGAWGCYRSHVRLWEDCLSAGVESVLVLEDDAVCCPDFAPKVLRFLEHVPPDWDQIYLGGQHLEAHVTAPRSEDGIVVRCGNVNRTHAYALRPKMMLAAYHEMSAAPHEPARQHHFHIDHRFGAMHATGKWNVYAPYRFLIGQLCGESDVSRRACKTLFWNEFPVEGVPELPLEVVPC